jgi:hypothetical protein
MKHGLWLVMAWWATAWAEVDTVELLPSPLVLPTRIGPMSLSGAPHKYADPRLGISYQYTGDGTSLTVYIYDSGEKDLPDGADTMPVCREYETAKQGVEQAYQKTQLRSERLVRLIPADDLPLMREAFYEYERDQRSTLSFIWITTVARHFVKLRLSMDPKLRDELPDARRALLSIMGEAIRPHLQPAEPNEKPPGTSLNFNMGGGSDDVMEAGVMYLMLLNAVAARHPEQAPVCGGDFVPGYETELGVYRAMFGIEAEAPRSRFGKRIRQIDEAGFLEEFVWIDLHRKSWGIEPPDGLTLPAYAAWKMKKLKRFRVPDFGSVTIDHPRPLPLEPATPAG